MNIESWQLNWSITDTALTNWQYQHQLCTYLRNLLIWSEIFLCCGDTVVQNIAHRTQNIPETQNKVFRMKTMIKNSVKHCLMIIGHCQDTRMLPNHQHINTENIPNGPGLRYLQYQVAGFASFHGNSGLCRDCVCVPTLMMLPLILNIPHFISMSVTVNLIKFGLQWQFFYQISP